MHTEIERGLRIRHATLFDQPDSLKLELSGKLPTLHDTPPVPSKHLTRCQPHRVQATAEKMGLKNRINNYHVTGWEGRSHKFSHAYNSARMWRSRNAFAWQDARDADAAKRLRSIFCRRYCKAVYLSVPIPHGELAFFKKLRILEKRVQSMAPPSMRKW